MRKKRPAKLSTTYVKDLKTPGRYGDGRGGFGLRLLVKPTSNGRWSKTWSQRIRIGGAIKTLGLGAFPLVTLAKARDKALDNARRVSEGEDIRAPRRKTPTVDEAFEKVIALRSPGWRGKKVPYQWSLSQRYCKPIGSKPISDVTQSEVLNILAPLWHTKNETANDVRAHLSAVMKWAITEEYRGNDPAASHITRNFGKTTTPVVHQPSLEHADVGRNLTLIRDANAWWAKKDCLLFLALTCVRNSEAREATWDEINLANATWTIPATRMKGKIMHRVPLSTQAIEILLHAKAKGNGSQDKVFPPRRSKEFMSTGQLPELMTKLEIPAVPHGFRSSFSNWAAEQTHIPEPAAEMVLAHVPSEAVKKAYRTSDFFKNRKPVMQEWADYLTKTMGPVISTLPDVSMRKGRVNNPVQAFNLNPIGEDEYKLIVQYVRESQTPNAWDAPDQATLRGAVDVAAIGIMRDGLLAAKETVATRWSDLRGQADGSGLLTIPCSKKKRPRTDHVTYVSPRTMKALDETRRIRRELRMNAKDDRIFQMEEKHLRVRIKKVCQDAGLTGTFSGYSPRNGMEQDLTRSGVAVNDLKRAKGWRMMGTTQTERESLARNGPVAQWYARKEPETQETPEGE